MARSDYDRAHTEQLEEYSGVSPMCQYVTVSLSSRYPDRNEHVLATLRELQKQRGIDYKLYNNPDYIEDAVDLPSIETDDGYRAYGVAAVQKFLQGQLRAT